MRGLTDNNFINFFSTGIFPQLPGQVNRFGQFYHFLHPALIVYDFTPKLLLNPATIKICFIDDDSCFSLPTLLYKYFYIKGR